MTQSQPGWYQPLQSLFISSILTLASPTLAQRLPIADDSLGNERSAVSPDRVIRGLPSNQIDGGARRGNNLFHSFREFNIENGRGVYFAHPAGVANILTRVTGSSRSEILGRLGVLGNANLFLLNPNGILFGPNARLDVAGSFVASTANSFVFDNGFAFSTTNPQVPPLLTVNVPIGLQFGVNSGEIRSQGATLQVPTGQTLTLVGGAVTIDGGQLLALGGRVELAGVAVPGQVGLTPERLSVPEGLGRADVAIENGANVNVRAGGGGNIAITARNIAVTGTGTFVLAGIATGVGTVGAQAGDIDLNATEAVNLETLAASDAIAVSNAVLTGGTGNAGDIRITTGVLSLVNGAQVNTPTLGQGNAGNITIAAKDTVSFNGADRNGNTSGAFSTVEAGAIGQGGDIRITTGKLSLTNGARVVASTYAQGGAGNITIAARETVSFEGTSGNGNFSGAFSTVEAGAIGQGGEINITTDALSVSQGAAVNVGIFGRGSAGSISITARDRVVIDGVSSSGFASGISSALYAQAIGQGGDIRITTGNLALTNGGVVSAPTFGRGDAGNITITARDAVTFEGVGSNGFSSGAYSAVTSGAVGEGGDISITTGVLTLARGAVINANMLGRGNAGTITITARDTISFDGVGSNRSGSGAYSAAEPGAIGNGSDIRITTGRLSLTNGGVLSTATFNQGDAGKITITARDTVSFDGVGSTGFSSGAYSAVTSTAIGQGGDIQITTGRLSLTNGAVVTANTFGRGKAGNIAITAQDRVTFEGVGSNGSPSAAASQVLSGAIGQGGNIRISTDKLSLTQGGVVSTSTFGRGNSGNIAITAQDRVTFEGVGSNGFASGAFSTVEAGGVGQGGDIRITTDKLALSNGAVVNASTFGQGDAGSIDIRARDAVDFDGIGRTGFASGAFSIVGSRAIGQGGDINITTGRLALTQAGAVSTLTLGQGNAGSINLTAEEAVNFDGVGSNGFPSGAYSSVASGAVGQGGRIVVQAARFSIANGGILTASSEGQGSAGNLNVNVRQLRLNNQGRIVAQTTAGQGGNIRLQIQDFLLLRRGSSVSTTAGTARAGGDGGNITFNGNFIAAVPNENSDISANAFTGRGGRVEIAAQGLFGIEFRSQLTPLSDITASSEFGIAGVVEIDTPDIDPSRGLVPLPVDLSDASRLIVQACPTGDDIAKPQNEFIITGRGGIPPTLSEALQRDAIQVDLVTVDDEDQPSVSQSPQPQRPESAIVEAQSWQTAADGTIFLVAAASKDILIPLPDRLMPCR